MICLRQIKISILKDTEDEWIKKICSKLRIDSSGLLSYKINHKSIDARDKKNIYYIYEFIVECINEEKVLKKVQSLDIFLYEEKKYSFFNKKIKLNDRPIIVGSGPSGLFCAYMLALSGTCPIILERGDEMDKRVKVVDEFFNNNNLDVNSNIQFGEGGAGTFSDGKLNTLVRDKAGRNQKVFEIFVENGAPEEILYLAKPHIGTDILRNVIKNIRNKIIEMGGEFHYRSQVTDLIIENNSIKGVVVNDGEKIMSSIVVLAIGHSARDTFLKLHELGFKMKPKKFAVGVRIEHKREMIDKSQYGEFASILGAANYKLTFNNKRGRGVYTFCMCPGGFVVNASSEDGMLAVNGMSNYKRDEVNSNSAVVVTVGAEDFGNDLFSGMNFQRELEKKAYIAGKGFIPVQLFGDFKNNKISSKYGEVIPNTKGKVNFCNLREVFPNDISMDIIEGIEEFNKKINGFSRDDSILLGVESRTSSPIIIERDDNFLSSIKGVYPCGEGAGYAGGITTAAIDGLKVAEAIINNSCV